MPRRDVKTSLRDDSLVGGWNGDGRDEVGVFHQGVVERPVTSE